MKRVLMLLIVLAVAAMAAFAWVPRAHANPVSNHAQGQIVDVRILEDGRVAPLYSRGWWSGSGRRYFEAFQGGHYAVELRNLTDRRIGVLMSVDGLNVVTGERSTLSPEESMYVLGPFESAVISGWRTSLDEVRQFVFVDEQRSYAERTGQANGDMGWVRVVAFDEQRPLSDWGRIRSSYRGGGAPPAPPAGEERAKSREDNSPPVSAPSGDRKAAGASPEAQGLARDEASQQRESVPGTGWGERREDHVQRTEFHAITTPVDQLVFRYEYASGLRALGIFPRRARVWERESGELGFAKSPQW